MGGGCFTDVMLHSSVSYHQKHAYPKATEPHRLHKNKQGVCGAVILLYNGVSSVQKILDNLWWHLRCGCERVDGGVCASCIV
jgi:hypothetical protein